LLKQVNEDRQSDDCDRHNGFGRALSSPKLRRETAVFFYAIHTVESD